MTRYAYDAADRLASATDAVGQVTSYAYDAMSRQIAVLNAAIQAAPLLQRSYTPDELAGSLTDANANMTSFAYDGFDRLSTTTYPDSSTEAPNYDAAGDVLTRQTRRGDTITFTYDTLNRLATKAAPSEPTVTYSYDLAGRMTGATDKSAAIPAPAAGGPYTTSYSYDALNRPVTVGWNQAPSQATPAASGVTFDFAYDPINRRASPATTDNSWWYHPPATPSTITYSANALSQYSAVGSVTPTYDGDGSLTYDGTITYGYDVENRLISVDQGSTAVASYAYNAQGRRKSKRVGTTTTITVTNAGNREVLEYDATSGQIEHWYAHGLGPADVLNQMNVAAARRETMIPDIQGSIIGTLDSASGTLTKTGYMPYGENASAAGTYRYTGLRVDPETNGLYYARARMYSPTWGRLLQPDPIGYAGGADLYAYVGNDPLNNVDPDGTQAIPGIVIGAISGGTAGYIVGGRKGATIGAVVGGGVGAGAVPLSAAADAVLTATGSSTLSATTAAVVFTVVNASAGAGATTITNRVLGNPAYQGVGTGALVGGLAPVFSGETTLVVMGGAAARRLPALTDYALSVQTGIEGVLGTAATNLTPPANSNVPTTGSYIGRGALNFGSQTMK